VVIEKLKEFWLKNLLLNQFSPKKPLKHHYNPKQANLTTQTHQNNLKIQNQIEKQFPLLMLIYFFRQYQG